MFTVLFYIIQFEIHLAGPAKSSINMWSPSPKAY